MKLKTCILRTVGKTAAGHKALEDPRYRVILGATASLVLNLSYGIYHGVLGMLGQSWWFVALSAYYTILGMTRFAAVLCEGKCRDTELERFVLCLTGVLLLLLSCVLAGISYLSLTEDIATQYGQITMITIATFTFGKITMAIIRYARYRRNPSALLAAIRGIGYAEVAVSVLTLQRSMLVSFGETDAQTRYLMNALTGAGVYLFVIALGIFMILGRRKDRGKIKAGKGKRDHCRKSSRNL